MTIEQAMIMAAGLGTRMRPLTNDRPKPLVTVAGKALIDHDLDRLVAVGVKRAVVNLHYKAGMLKKHLARRRDIEIAWSDETGELLGTGGGVAHALTQFDNKPFFILNSDSVWVEGVSSALDRMIGRGTDAVAGLWAALAFLAGGWPPLAILGLAMVVLGRRDAALNWRSALPVLAAAVGWSAWAYRSSPEAWGVALTLPLAQRPAWLLAVGVAGLTLPWGPLAPELEQRLAQAIDRIGRWEAQVGED